MNKQLSSTAPTIDRRPIAAINTATAAWWREGDPVESLVRRVGQVVKHGYERVLLHQPGRHKSDRANVLMQYDRLSDLQWDAIEEVRDEFGIVTQWGVSIGGQIDKMAPVEWMREPASGLLAWEVSAWAENLSPNPLVIVDGLGDNAHAAFARKACAGIDVTLGSCVLPYDRVDAEYDDDGELIRPGRMQLNETKESADVVLASMLHVQNVNATSILGKIEKERHLWLTGHFERRLRNGGRPDYREIDDYTTHAWARDGGVVSVMSDDDVLLERVMRVNGGGG